MFKKMWELLNTPPPKLEISILENISDNIDNAIGTWLVNQLNISIVWLTNLMMSSPVQFLLSPEFNRIYIFVFKISLAILLPIIGWHGFCVLSNSKSVDDVLDSLAGLWKYPIGVMLAPKLITGLLSVVNTLTGSLLTMQSAIATLAPKLDLILIIFSVVYVYLIIQIILYYCYRNFALVFLATVAPIIILLWSFDNGEKLMQWKNEILSLALSQLVHVLQLVILSSIISYTTDSVLGFSLQIGALIYMVKSPDWLSRYIGVPNPAYLNPRKLVGGLGNVVKKVIK